MKVFIITTFPYCINNSHLTTRIYDFIKYNKIELVNKDSYADAIIIVTCGFDDERENYSLNLINQYVKKYKNKKIIVTGCLPKINPVSLNIPGVTLISLQELNKLDKIFKSKIKIKNIKGNKINPNFVGDQIMSQPDIFYIEIAQGCSNNCSYCVIKKAKFSVKSKPIEKIIKEMKFGITNGYKKFFLLADDCGSYGLDIGFDLADLLNELSKEKNIKLYLQYLFPRQFVELYPKFNKKVWNKIGSISIPIQSNSPRILKLMNRNYNPVDVFKLITKIRKVNPDIVLESHIIIGFPSETRKEFYQNYIMKKYFNLVFFYHYSEKKGTLAQKLNGKISEKELAYRINMLINESKKTKVFRLMHTKNYIINQFESIPNTIDIPKFI